MTAPAAVAAAAALVRRPVVRLAVAVTAAVVLVLTVVDTAPKVVEELGYSWQSGVDRAHRDTGRDLSPWGRAAWPTYDRPPR